jgi:regulator of sigma E protease
MSVILLIIGLVLFVALVVLHEFGHFIMARRNGVEVEEFGIGFPPTLWKKRINSPKGDYDFTLNALPLGGFVKLKGENDSDAEKGTFGAATLWAKVKIMLAGVAMNLFTAFILLSLLAAIGMPKIIDDQFTVKSDTSVTQQSILVGYLEPDSPAAKAGLQARDELKSIRSTQGTQAISSKEGFPEITKNLAGQEVELAYSRKGEAHTAKLQLRSSEEVEASRKTDSPKGYLGVSPVEFQIRRSTWSAPIVAAGIIKQFTQLTLSGIGSALGNLFAGDTAKASEQVSGPVGIFVILQEGSSLGYRFVLMIIAIISLTLAIFNFLPIPALDGGRLFVTLLYRLLNVIARLFDKSVVLTERAEGWIHGTGFATLMVLFLLITVVDIKRFF